MIEKRQSRVFTRQEIDGLIAAGDTLIIADSHVLRLNAWQDLHPGGRLVIQHMVGRDATDELAISHSLETLKSMNRYRIGRIEGNWINFTPPIQGGTFSKCIANEKEEGERALKHKGRLALSEASSLDVSECTYTANTVQAEIDADIAKYPSLDAATQREITNKFRMLHQRVHDEGFYDCRFIEYGKEMLRYASLFALFVFFLRREWFFTSACFLGLFWHQIMFTAHDAGHRGITHNFVVDSLIGIFIGNFCSGLSIGWWKSSHNVHHFVTNDPVHDPDIQNVPLFVTSPAFFTGIRSSYYNGFRYVWDAAADYAVKYQRFTYYPIMAVARFNLYFLSWGHLLSRRSITRGSASWTRSVEILSIACYLFLYFYVLLWCQIPTWWSRAVFLVTSHLITMPLHVQITLSHWGTSTSDLGPSEAFAQRQLRTTMDVACPAWLDFIHGGLQFQAVHHLFPRVPRHNLRKLQELVREFCEETKIEYLILGFLDGNKDVLGKLQQVADQAKLMAACQAHMASTGESGLH
ncbi:Putative cytochrome b5-like heme/steroid binding domain, fatty acid desaturase [Septoria linicola]|uniref:Delta 8-(E)-sphingolipid desaturase n=1 Tax=Septoria linicola TaxID=215465 RepID=A0A9Q9B468_9PEZI|nr:putative cytochrome b5-like heme/steroid binding domain, fatty acid desaturase [Septoria linicola]USW57910.1 Putative cytochrome b5-like heme/steroid binding domain, fatty acid desaturase [Septoria linicola]